MHADGTMGSSSAASKRVTAAANAFVMSDRRREEVTRLIVQALHDLGYDEASSLVERQSRISCTTERVEQFRAALLHGQWDEVETLLPALPGIPPEDLTVRLSSFLSV